MSTQADVYYDGGLHVREIPEADARVIAAEAVGAMLADAALTIQDLAADLRKASEPPYVRFEAARDLAREMEQLAEKARAFDPACGLEVRIAHMIGEGAAR